MRHGYYGCWLRIGLLALALQSRWSRRLLLAVTSLVGLYRWTGSSLKTGTDGEEADDG